MALIVRLSILGRAWSGSQITLETPLTELEIVNRGRPLDAHPGALDAATYEVREWVDGKMTRSVWVDHWRTAGAAVLAEKALRALRPERKLRPGQLSAPDWLQQKVTQWAAAGADPETLSFIISQALDAHIEGARINA